jgi:triacylglycerol esterase/lipase EstA (alpha/beta hydrolase family)
MRMSTDPRARPRRGGRFVIGLAALAVVATTLIAAAPAPVEAQTARDPIVFVHGWNSSASTWNTMISRFQAAGYSSTQLYAFTYNSNQSNATIAGQVRDAVNTLRSRTGAARVDIIAHSMGSLSSRYYLKNLGGSAVVDDWVSLAGPNHGTNTAYLCYLVSAGCRDMIPGSSFLNALNSGDETPGTTNYGTFWSNSDDVINPDSSVLLSGATNTFAGSIEHSDFLSRSDVFTMVRGFVA